MKRTIKESVTISISTLLILLVIGIVMQFGEEPGITGMAASEWDSYFSVLIVCEGTARCDNLQISEHGTTGTAYTLNKESKYTIEIAWIKDSNTKEEIDCSETKRGSTVFLKKDGGTVTVDGQKLTSYINYGGTGYGQSAGTDWKNCKQKLTIDASKLADGVYDLNVIIYKPETTAGGWDTYESSTKVYFEIAAPIVTTTTLPARPAIALPKYHIEPDEDYVIDDGQYKGTYYLKDGKWKKRVDFWFDSKVAPNSELDKILNAILAEEETGLPKVKPTTTTTTTLPIAAPPTTQPKKAPPKATTTTLPAAGPPATLPKEYPKAANDGSAKGLTDETAYYYICRKKDYPFKATWNNGEWIIRGKSDYSISPTSNYLPKQGTDILTKSQAKSAGFDIDKADKIADVYKLGRGG